MAIAVGRGPPALAASALLKPNLTRLVTRRMRSFFGVHRSTSQWSFSSVMVREGSIRGSSTACIDRGALRACLCLSQAARRTSTDAHHSEQNHLQTRAAGLPASALDEVSPGCASSTPSPVTRPTLPPRSSTIQDLYASTRKTKIEHGLLICSSRSRTLQRRSLQRRSPTIYLPPSVFPPAYLSAAAAHVRWPSQLLASQAKHIVDDRLCVHARRARLCAQKPRQCWQRISSRYASRVFSIVPSTSMPRLPIAFNHRPIRRTR